MSSLQTESAGVLSRPAGRLPPDRTKMELGPARLSAAPPNAASAAIDNGTGVRAGLMASPSEDTVLVLYTCNIYSSIMVAPTLMTLAKNCLTGWGFAIA
jgi:hypothetical protein